MTMNMRFFIIAAAATLLAACTQENEVQNNPVEARITAGVKRAEDPCCGQRVERRPNRRDGGGCPWHDHDHGRQVQERGIRDHEYRHQRGLHPR